MKSRPPSPVASLLVRAVAVLAIFAVATFNTAYVSSFHLHVLPNGRVVVHSHPVDGDEENGSRHQHTGHEYVILSALGSLLQVDHVAIDWSPVYIEPVTSLVEFSDENDIACLVARSINKRGPPKVVSG